MESDACRLLEGVPHSKRVVTADRAGVIQRVVVVGAVGRGERRIDPVELVEFAEALGSSPALYSLSFSQRTRKPTSTKKTAKRRA